MELNLIPSSKSVLTKTDEVPDPNKPGSQIAVSYRCDINGDRVADAGLPVYRDAYTGKSVVRIAEVIPSATDTASKEAAAAILALKPIFYVSGDGSIKGYFVPAPDFNNRETPTGVASGKAPATE